MDWVIKQQQEISALLCTAGKGISINTSLCFFQSVPQYTCEKYRDDEYFWGRCALILSSLTNKYCQQYSCPYVVS